MNELNNLIKQANRVYRDNFPNNTWFERALFFSWSCAIKDCAFCYMSTQKKKNRDDGDDRAVRSKESLYAETIICKHLGWKIGFFTGGVNAYQKPDITEMLEVINQIIEEKIWVSLGPIPKSHLKEYQPYIKGVVGSIETVNRELHKKVCPSKPMEPYVKMFNNSTLLGLKNAMTLILGLGETKDDFETLKEFIEENNIKKIHLYALNPVKGTLFENKESPSKEYHAWYVAKTRIAFPKIDIQMGIWKDKIDRIPLLLEAGTNSISKFPIIREFRSKSAKEIENQAKKTGRNFLGSLTTIPNVNWDKEVDKLSLDQEMKEKVRLKLKQYLRNMS
ncbi:MAG: radical SAM protein [Nanoarchaeota archaeon]|nr:radical SAM protein [DPANN group archaeon]MBL7116344.1 radical SAM protein [Nanoarchaeota archaeon]